MSRAPAVYVVIVNYRSAKLVRQCIDSLASQPIDKVLIVDNDSGGGEIAELQSIAASTRNVEIVQNSNNSGFGAGVNLGVAAADGRDGDYLWVLNPDTVIHEGCVAELIRVLENGSAIASPIILNGRIGHEKIWFAGGEVDTNAMKTPHRHFGTPVEYADSLPPVLRTGFITGTAPFLTFGIWNLLGGLREDLFMYWEDADFSVRANAAGMRMDVATRARVWHAVGGTSGEHGLSPLYYRFMQRNRVRLAREWGASRNVFRGRGLVQTLTLLSSPLFEPSRRIASARASLGGLREGLREK
ncbi:glycosyltransferase family 2 protein [Rhodococcus sp. BL-253-APC-6A1W]|uniref:glycosyltransferase family 2 protein n=1 Tax=Rhodococcus sp. BL-253-APC-6A1W TaxID=2725307 RepID=UPI00146E7155|nr:glycosyltransferase family 2 protein [Rhodococcus sp. BL-253-APC-6A1W]NMD93850.1 glycosyltransferase family 2 protein [Rhodococcus sp. BL-253-APC-6A1W]